jgi:hypothetical protein
MAPRPGSTTTSTTLGSEGAEPQRNRPTVHAMLTPRGLCPAAVGPPRLSFRRHIRREDAICSLLPRPPCRFRGVERPGKGERVSWRRPRLHPAARVSCAGSWQVRPGPLIRSSGAIWGWSSPSPAPAWATATAPRTPRQMPSVRGTSCAPWPAGSRPTALALSSSRRGSARTARTLPGGFFSRAPAIPLDRTRSVE